MKGGDSIHIKFQWETMHLHRGNRTRRAGVYGGWIIETSYFDDHTSIGTSSMCFVPDPEHKWKV